MTEVVKYLEIFSIAYDPLIIGFLPITFLINLLLPNALYPILSYWSLSVRKLPVLANFVLSKLEWGANLPDSFGIQRFLVQEHIIEKYNRASEAYNWRMLMSVGDDIFRT